MSCNGCRVLRKGCSDACILRPCLEWIESAEAQAHATLFVAKFFGRADLMSFISAVPYHQRPALFQSLLFEACGRTINPVHGAVGLLSSGNWHVCHAAVDTVLRGGILRPIPPQLLARALTLTPPPARVNQNMYGIPYTQQILNSDMHFQPLDLIYDVTEQGQQVRRETMSFDGSETSTTTTSFGDCGGDDGNALGIGGRQERKLLNLFV